MAARWPTMLRLLVSIFLLGAAFSLPTQETTAQDTPQTNRHGRFVAVQMLAGLTSGFASEVKETITEVTDRVIWREDAFIRRSLLAANDTDYEQQAINAANARAAAAMAITPRFDPTDGFKKYEGGYNVTNMHYWASVVFTGVYGFALAIISLIVGILYLLLKCFCACCCSSRKGKPTEYTITGRLWPKVLVLLFTLLAIAGAVVVYTGNGKLSTSLHSTTGTVVDAVAEISLEVDQVAGALQNATQALNDPSSGGSVIDSAKSLQEATSSVNLTVQKNKTKVYDYFGKVKLALTILAAIVIATGVAGLATSILGVRPLLLLLFIFGLIVLFFTWLLFGITFMLDNVIVDTCTGMEQYTLNPANSTLGKLLPCIDQDTANQALNNGKKSVKDLVKQVNNGIDNANHDRAAALVLYPTLNPGNPIPNLCDPYGPAPDYPAATCPAGQGTLGTFRNDYSAYACANDDSNQCSRNHTPIKQTDFNKMVNATGAAQDVVTIMPVLFNLVTCQFVKVTFTEVVTTDCSPLKTSLNLLWIGFVVISVALVFLEIHWMIVRTRAQRNDSSRVRHINDQPL